MISQDCSLLDYLWAKTTRPKRGNYRDGDIGGLMEENTLDYGARLQASMVTESSRINCSCS